MAVLALLTIHESFVFRTERSVAADAMLKLLALIAEDQLASNALLAFADAGDIITKGATTLRALYHVILLAADAKLLFACPTLPKFMTIVT